MIVSRNLQHHKRDHQLMTNRQKININRIRIIVLSSAFLLILINPFLNYYFQINYIQGWFQSFGLGNLWFVSPLEGLESLLITKQIFLPTIIGMLLPITLAMCLGSVYCSWLCPISFFSEIIDRLRRRLSGKKWLKDLVTLPRYIIWYVLVAEILISMTLAAPLFVFLSPPGLVGREIMTAVFFHTLALEGIIILVVLWMNFITKRFFCRYFCPLGATLNILGANRKLRVIQDLSRCNNCKKCDYVCPRGLKPSTGMTESIYCWNCGECTMVCEPKALDYHWGEKRVTYGQTGLQNIEPNQS